MEEGRCYAVGERGCDGVGAAAHGVCVFFRLRRNWSRLHGFHRSHRFFLFVLWRNREVTQKAQKGFWLRRNGEVTCRGALNSRKRSPLAGTPNKLCEKVQKSDGYQQITVGC